MNTCIECLPCLGRNAVDAVRRAACDERLRRVVLQEAFRLLAENDYTMPPPYLARKILDTVQKYTGCGDLYREEKRRSNLLAEELLAELPKIPEYCGASFESRLRLAAAGNILDFGIFTDLDIGKALDVVRSAFRKDLDLASVRKLQEKMDSAKGILYILDNCGEAVFDRVFMIPYREKITLGVRGRAVFNDVTAEDLPGCGLDGWNFVDSGPSGIPGTILSECSDAFRRAFETADLIIAKGQGNFETMNEYREPMAFLFLAKCPVVTRELGVEMNSLQVRLSGMEPPAGAESSCQ